MSKEPEITYSELMAEVAKYKRTQPNVITFTDQQFKFVDQARAKNMQWHFVLALWKKAGWTQINLTTLMKKYYEMKTENKRRGK